VYQAYVETGGLFSTKIKKIFPSKTKRRNSHRKMANGRTCKEKIYFG
jgi:hypothetical protein